MITVQRQRAHLNKEITVPVIGERISREFPWFLVVFVAYCES